MGSLIRATSLTGFRELVEQLGGSPKLFMDRRSLPIDAAERHDYFFPYKTLAQLLEDAADVLDFPNFALTLGSAQGLAVLGPIAVIARNSETVAAAFTAISRYLYVHSPALRASSMPDSKLPSVRLSVEIVEPGLVKSSQAYELTMAVAVQILRLVGGRDARPSAVFFPHQALGRGAEYRRIFGCPVYFSQSWCGWLLCQGLAEKKINEADTQARDLARSYLELNASNLSPSYTNQVEELIRRLLPTGECKIEIIAENLALHPRTLQRRLSDEGCRYEGLVDECRREAALRYLNDSGMHLSQISGLLGYAEQSAFNRAFRRWHQLSPTQYRKKNFKNRSA